MDLGQRLGEHGLGDYLAAFVDHEVSIGDLPHLIADDLTEIGLPVGPRRRFLTAAAKLRSGVRQQADEMGVDAADRTVRRAERRQMTFVRSSTSSVRQRCRLDSTRLDRRTSAR